MAKPLIDKSIFKSPSLEPLTDVNILEFLNPLLIQARIVHPDDAISYCVRTCHLEFFPDAGYYLLPGSTKKIWFRQGRFQFDQALEA